MKSLFPCLILATLSLHPLLAQTMSSAPFSANPGLSDSAPTPERVEKGEKVSDSSSGAATSGAAATSGTSGPTVIDSDNMDYDEKTRIAVFTGDNYGVFLKDPQFTINCNKLTAYMRKAAATNLSAARGKSSPAPKPTPAPKASPGAAAVPAKANGLSRAVAEGSADQPVVIVQDKPASGDDQPQHNVGIAQKADYNADTGDVKLTGWPRVSQGVNTQIATSVSTIMIMNKDSKKMTTIGPSRSIIQEQDQSKKDDGKSGSPAPAQ